MSSLMVGIFSDVPRQGAPKGNHHAHPAGGVPGTGAAELSRGLDAPTRDCPEVPASGLAARASSGGRQVSRGWGT